MMTVTGRGLERSGRKYFILVILSSSILIFVTFNYHYHHHSLLVMEKDKKFPFPPTNFNAHFNNSSLCSTAYSFEEIFSVLIHEGNNREKILYFSTWKFYLHAIDTLRHFLPSFIAKVGINYIKVYDDAVNIILLFWIINFCSIERKSIRDQDQVFVLSHNSFFSLPWSDIDTREKVLWFFTHSLQSNRSNF